MSKPNMFVVFVRDYILCCFFPESTYDPTVFQENHPRYRACFGCFHVKNVSIVLACFKIMVGLSILIHQLLFSDDELLKLFGAFSFVASGLSNFLLIAGVHSKRYLFIIPYFAACLLFIFVLTLHLFYSFLDTANQKNSLQFHSLANNLAMLALIIFELYTLIVVWRTFVYICDYRMDQRLKKAEWLMRSRHMSVILSVEQQMRDQLKNLKGTAHQIAVGYDSESDSSTDDS